MKQEKMNDRLAVHTCIQDIDLFYKKYKNTIDPVTIYLIFFNVKIKILQLK